MRYPSLQYGIFFIATAVVSLCSCSLSRSMGKSARSILLEDSAIATGHIGISIYEPATNTYWYNYNAEKNFIPASNTKLFTLYAGMKYLGDSLIGLQYQNISDTGINIIATGDPTFLHPDFRDQPVLDFLQRQTKSIYISDNFMDTPEGKGWTRDDYAETDDAERSPFPVYGNVMKISVSGSDDVTTHYSIPKWLTNPIFFKQYLPAQFEVSLKYFASRTDSIQLKKLAKSFIITRSYNSNILTLKQGSSIFNRAEIPFVTDGLNTAVSILKSDFQLNIRQGRLEDERLYGGIPDHLRWHSVHSRPVDSLFKPMMYNSDNFFAEQTLLMVSNQHLGYMNDAAIIDTLLKTDLSTVPQRPKWVDGCGLSRYNLFTPKAFVYVLNKMKDEFGLARLEHILPTGGTGTLSRYYKKDSSYIFAKTGTLSNNCALSGFLYTKKNKLLIFSILVNDYITGATPIRKSVEHFLEEIREKY